MTNRLTVDTIRKMTKTQLIAMVKRGKLSFNMTDENTSHERDELPEYKKFKHLAGKEIHISMGARKYKVSQPTISRWVKKGLIKTLGMDKNKVIINEQDLAYCAWVRHERQKGSKGSGQGQWLFDPQGLPYIPEKTEE